MPEILPAILAKTEAEFRAKVERVRPLGLTLHIDVMDGVFVRETTWAAPEMLQEILGDTPFEAHLMVANPEHLVPVWVAAGASRVFYHAEAANHDEGHIDDIMCKVLGADCVKAGIAANPETSASAIIPRLGAIKKVMAMGVKPGRSGQTFDIATLQKIMQIKHAYPDAFVVVDGGVKTDNAAAIVAAGADALVIGSALTDAAEPLKAFHAFMEKLR